MKRPRSTIHFVDGSNREVVWDGAARNVENFLVFYDTHGRAVAEINRYHVVSIDTEYPDEDAG